ncbi:Crp/Fnr family transcriptional regulator [Undibacterium sp. RuRC25W]|uniref:Crp/Fnr family transcriptional regulator n=1 Tax=Undibacterium sp. RuRC25W TaxID=3413047 RepID=UPI003BEFDF11
MPCRALVQIAGYAYRVRADVLLREFNQTGATFRLLLRYTQSLITQTTQTAVCNRHHSIEQQLCRWLLLTNERVNCDEIAVTQEAIANVLGVRREGITEAAGYLQDLRYISYRRGHITILNQRGLEEHVCECYGVVKKEFHRLMDHACESHAHRTPGIRLLSPIFPPTFPPVIPPVYPPTGLMSNQWRK